MTKKTNKIVFLLSPAKSLDFLRSHPERKKLPAHEPKLVEDTQILLQNLKKKSTKDIKALMKVSDAIAKLNYDR